MKTSTLLAVLATLAAAPGPALSISRSDTLETVATITHDDVGIASCGLKTIADVPGNPRQGIGFELIYNADDSGDPFGIITVKLSEFDATSSPPKPTREVSIGAIAVQTNDLAHRVASESPPRKRESNDGWITTTKGAPMREVLTIFSPAGFADRGIQRMRPGWMENPRIVTITEAGTGKEQDIRVDLRPSEQDRETFQACMKKLDERIARSESR